MKKFPIILEESDECKYLFSSDTFFNHFLKPVYRYLPSNGEEDDRFRHKLTEFKNIKKGTYLVALDVISRDELSLGFCAILLRDYGLVLNEGRILNTQSNEDNDYNKSSFFHLSFEHIILQ
jgi:hypothetical protein